MLPAFFEILFINFLMVVNIKFNLTNHFLKIFNCFKKYIFLKGVYYDNII